MAVLTEHLDKKMLAESNVIMCLDTIGGHNINSMTNASEKFAIKYPWILIHSEGQEEFLKPSRIDQQLYFYNADTGSLHERYSVNSFIVTRILDISKPMAPLHERRADFQGIELTVAVNVYHPQHGLRDTTNLEVITMPSGDKMHVVDEDNSYGVLKDFLSLLMKELNFTVR